MFVTSRNKFLKVLLITVAILTTSTIAAQESEDPWLFLEEIDGINALACGKWSKFKNG